MSIYDSVSIEKEFKLAVCVPARDQMHTATSFCLYNLAQALTRAKIEHNLFVSAGTLIVNQRQELVRSAQEWSASHLLFVDSDMEFTPEDFFSLKSRAVDIIAAAYSKRVEPFHSTAWHDITDWSSHVKLNSTDTGVVNCQAVGLGFCLIDMSVFDQIEQPWFKLGWSAGQYTGEDIEFCRLVQQAGYQVNLDLDVSRRIGHLGTTSFKLPSKQ